MRIRPVSRDIAVPTATMRLDRSNPPRWVAAVTSDSLFRPGLWLLVELRSLRARCQVAALGPLRVFERKSQALQLAHEIIDVVAENTAVSGADAHFDRAGDELVETGVEQSQPIASRLRDLLHALRRAELCLEGRNR